MERVDGEITRQFVMILCLFVYKPVFTSDVLLGNIFVFFSKDKVFCSEFIDYII